MLHLSIFALPSLVVSSILSLLACQNKEHMASPRHRASLLLLLLSTVPPLALLKMMLSCTELVFHLCPSLKGNSCVFISRSMFFFLHIVSLLIVLFLPIKPRQLQRQPQSTNSVQKKADWYPQREAEQQNYRTLWRQNRQTWGFSSDLEEMFTCGLFSLQGIFL